MTYDHDNGDDSEDDVYNIMIDDHDNSDDDKL